MSTGAVVALAFGACLILLGIAVGIYFAVKGGDEETTTPAPSPAPRGPAPSPSDPCAGLTPTSLAKDVPVSCLQKTWTDAGCSVTGTVYPVAGSKGWWNSSPGGLGTTVYCDPGGKISGDAAGNCGAGNYGAIIADMNYWANSTRPGSVTEPSRVSGCRGP
jgi:hypothetical protein